MVPNITTILPRFTGEWAMRLQPEALLTICREIGYTAWRDRVLTPVTTVQLFLWQMLHSHTACSHPSHLSGLRCRAAASCQARVKLPLCFFNLLLERFGSAVQRSALDEGRWQGHRACLVEGSGCSMPDTSALQAAFGQPTAQRPGCGVPVARLLGLFHAGTDGLLKLVVAPLLTHDLARVQAVLRVGARPMVDVTLGRPFVRPSVRRTPAFKGVPRSRWLTTRGVHDRLVMGLKPKTCSSWLARETWAALPDS